MPPISIIRQDADAWSRLIACYREVEGHEAGIHGRFGGLSFLYFFANNLLCHEAIVFGAKTVCFVLNQY